MSAINKTFAFIIWGFVFNNFPVTLRVLFNAQTKRPTTMTLETMIAYIVALAIVVAVPGPAVFAIIAQAMTRGISTAFIQLSGMILGDVCYLVVSAYGLSALAVQMGELFLLIKLAGAAYLIWLGWTSWTQKVEAADDPNIQNANKGRAFFAGLAVTLGNPKAMVFYLALLPTFIDLTAIEHSDILMLVAFTVAILGLELGVYILAAAKLRSAVSKPSIRKLFNRISGTVMVGSGIAIAVRN